MLTKEQQDFILANYKGKSHRKMAELLNAKFGLSISKTVCRRFYNKHGLNSGLTGRFQKGHDPANKGKKLAASVIAKVKKTWFKQGHTPHNHKPVGSERITKDGYTKIKVAEPDFWRLKHQVIYEKFYGKIPKGYAVCFADMNKKNFEKDNLVLVSRSELATMNKKNKFSEFSDITKTELNLLRFERKIRRFDK